MKAVSTGADQVIQQSCYKVKSLAKILDLSPGNDSQATSNKPQATSGKPTPGGGGEKAFYKKVLDKLEL